MKKITRTAKANWQGTLKEGKGTVSTSSGLLNNANYSFKTRFEEGEAGTNPEELLGAAHASCFTMWVSSVLTAKGFKPLFLDTEATITMEDSVIVGTHLKISGSVEGITAPEFEAATKESAKNCIISKALSIPITSESILIPIPSEVTLIA
jgi:osmotically inducible protein OsmC